MKSLILSLLLTAGAAETPDPEDLMLRINLPEHRLEVLEGVEVIRSYPATIGKTTHRTPTGRYRISSITWNPWWTPPASPWARGKKKTPPGPDNPMGRAKLRFDDLLYVHGTANEAALGSAASHGCIRLANEDVLELARLIAERQGILDDDTLAALERDGRRTREVPLPVAVPVVIMYRLVTEGPEGVRRHDDVYNLGLQPHEAFLLREAEALDAPADGPALAPSLPPAPVDGSTERP